MAEPKTAKAPSLNEEGQTVGFMFGALIDQTEYNSDLKGHKGIKVYNEMRLGDATVQASLLAVILPLLSANWNVEPAGDNRRDKEIADFVDKNLHSMTSTWQQFLWELLLFLPFGHYVFEKVYEFRDTEDQKIWLRKLAPRPPLTIVNWKLENGDDGIVQNVDGTAIEIEMDKLVVFTYRKEAGNWSGISILRSAYKHWFMKDKMYLIGSISAERQGLGIPYAELPAGTDKVKQAEIEEILQNIRASEKGYATWPQTWKVGFMDMKAGSLRNMQPEIQHHDRQISKNVLAQFLELGQQTGSFALSADQSSLFYLSLQAIATYIEDTFTDYVIKPLVDYNYNVEAYPRLSASGIGKVDYNMLTTAIQRAVQVGVLTADENIETFLRTAMDLPDKSEFIPLDINMADSMFTELEGELSEVSGMNTPVDDMPAEEDIVQQAAESLLEVMTAGAPGIPLDEETKKKISEALTKGKKKAPKAKKAPKKANPEVVKRNAEIMKLTNEVNDFKNESRRKLLELKVKGDKITPKDQAKLQLELLNKQSGIQKKIANLRGEIATFQASEEMTYIIKAKEKIDDIIAKLETE